MHLPVLLNASRIALTELIREVVMWTALFLSLAPQKEMCFLLIIVYVTENTKYMQLFSFTCQNG